MKKKIKTSKSNDRKEHLMFIFIGKYFIKKEKKRNMKKIYTKENKYIILKKRIDSVCPFPVNSHNQSYFFNAI